MIVTVKLLSSIYFYSQSTSRGEKSREPSSVTENILTDQLMCLRTDGVGNSKGELLSRARPNERERESEKVKMMKVNFAESIMKRQHLLIAYWFQMTAGLLELISPTAAKLYNPPPLFVLLRLLAVCTGVGYSLLYSHLDEAIIKVVFDGLSCSAKRSLDIIEFASKTA